MFLDFAGTLVNLDHVAQVEPYTPGAGKRLTVILSNGNAVHVPDGNEASRLLAILKGEPWSPVAERPPAPTPPKKRKAK